MRYRCPACQKVVDKKIMIFLDQESQHMVCCQNCAETPPQVDADGQTVDRPIKGLLLFRDILSRCHNLPIEEENIYGLTFRRLVMYSSDYDKWEVVFKETLGEPAKPCGVDASDLDNQLTQPFRGIDRHQTLYRKEMDRGYYMIVMVWPWKDPVYKSIRVILSKNE